MTQQNKRVQAPQMRRSAPVKAGGSGDTVRLIVICIIAIAVSIALQCIWPDGFPVHPQQGNELAAASQVSEIFSEGPLRINEVMTGNRDTIVLEGDVSPDWIEIMNVGAKTVKLGGYALGKSADDVRTFTFPEMSLQAGECVLVYADSRLRDVAGEDLHAPFRLSSAGDTLMLFNAGGSAIDTVNIPALQKDASYARADVRAWQVSDMPTPGLENTRENYLALKQPADNSPVIITEIMSSNASTLADENGEYYDYIELYNCSGESVNIGGWYLSDDETQLRKWRIPDVQLNAGECIVIHASKLDRREDAAHLHTNFGLSSEGESLLLVSPEGRIMDRVDFDLLKADTALCRSADGNWMVSAANPGTYN